MNIKKKKGVLLMQITNKSLVILAVFVTFFSIIANITMIYKINTFDPDMLITGKSIEDTARVSICLNDLPQVVDDDCSFNLVSSYLGILRENYSCFIDVTDLDGHSFTFYSENKYVDFGSVSGNMIISGNITGTNQTLPQNLTINLTISDSSNCKPNSIEFSKFYESIEYNSIINQIQNFPEDNKDYLELEEGFSTYYLPMSNFFKDVDDFALEYDYGFDDNIIFGVDVSGSMLADDIKPNRIISTKNNLATVLDNKTINSQIALFAFTSINYPILSFTDDKLELISNLDNIKIANTHGTSLGNALMFGYAMFDSLNSDKNNLIVLITDGQENIITQDELVNIIDLLKSKDIDIFVIGLGSVKGGRISANITGTSVVNEANLKLFGDDNYIIVEDNEIFKEILDGLFVQKSFKNIIPLDKYLYILCFIFLIFEWYLSNSIFRSFP
jgi:hypothetical protein